MSKDNKNGTDLVSLYADRYATDGDENTASYTKRMSKDTATYQAEIDLINNVIEEARDLYLESSNLHKSETSFVRVADIGGASGRHYEVYKNAQHKFLSHCGLGLEVVVCDIIAPDESYKRILKNDVKMGFSEHNFDYMNDALVEKKADFTSAIGNLKFTFVQSPAIDRDTNNVTEITNEMRQVIGDCEGAVSMFGSISHIELKENRNKILSVMNDISEGNMGIILPSRNVHLKDIEAYNNVRKKEEDIYLGEDGDAKYLDERGKAVYYHHYDKAEVEEDLEKSGVEDFKVVISTFSHPLGILKHPIIDNLDYPLSKALNNAGMASDYTASYFEARSHNPRTREIKSNESTKLLSDRYKSSSSSDLDKGAEDKDTESPLHQSISSEETPNPNSISLQNEVAVPLKFDKKDKLV